MNAIAHLKGLQGLRALGALAVFGVHYNQTVDVCRTIGPIDIGLLLKHGEVGVSVFFTLSGFLLSRPFWAHRLLGTAKPDLRTYALHRLARVAPAYYLCLTVLIVLSGYWRVPDAQPDLILHYSYIFNYAEFSFFSINAPFWTLAVEVQFYLLLPFLFPFIRGGSAPLRILLIAMIAYTIHFILNVTVDRVIAWPWSDWQIWIRPHGAVISHSLLAHLPHFLLGVAGAWLMIAQSDKAIGAGVPDVVFWSSGMLLIFMLSTPLADDLSAPYGRYELPVIPLLLAGLVMAAPGARLAANFLDSPPLRYIGLISYGVYLYHLPILIAVDRWMGVYGLDAAERWMIFGLTGLSLTLLVAALSYHLIERPISLFVRARLAAR